MKIKFKKLHKDAKAPFKAHTWDAGFDLTAVSAELDEENSVVSYGTGLAIEIPEGFVGLLFPRSSIYKQDLSLANAVGVLDSGFIGEISFKFKAAVSKDSSRIKVYETGERIGQLIVMPIPHVTFEETEELGETERGSGGYGSTGK